MDKKLYINKKILLTVILLSLIYIIATYIYGVNNDLFTSNEKKYIKDNSNVTITLGYKENNIFSNEILEKFKNNIYSETGLNIIFKPVSSELINKVKVLNYPTVIVSHKKVLNLNNLNDYKFGILNDLSVDRNNNIAIYNKEKNMISDLKNSKIDYIVTTPNNVIKYLEKGLFYITSSDITINVEFYYKDKSVELEKILKKEFEKYYIELNIEDLQNEKINSYLKKNILTKIREEDKEIINKKDKLVVGIEECPPISYYDNSNIYGLSIGYVNLLGKMLDIPIEYIIGESDELYKLYLENKVDYLFLKNESYEGLKSLTFYNDRFLLVSSIHHEIVENIYTIKNKVGYYGNIKNIENDKNVVMITSFDSLVKSIDDKSIDYYIISESLYDFLNSHKTVSLFINKIIDEKSHYEFICKNQIYKKLMDNVILISDTNYLYTKSLNSIEKDKNTKNYAIAISTLILFVLIIYVVIKIVLNVNEKKRLNYLFNHDQLTYLLNSYGMEKLFNKKYKENENGLLIILTINKFQLLTDRLGSNKLDLLLIELGNEFKLLSKNAYIGRTSANEFTFLLFNSNNIAFIEKILLTINNYKNESIYKELFVSISYVQFPKFSDEYEVLVKYGHSALYNHGNELNNVIVEFDEKVYAKYLDEEMLVNEIKAGILNSDFLLYYQPQIDLNSGVAIGAEVLIRWEHKERGFIYPNQFLPIAEKNNLMRSLDFYMIKNVCSQIKFWQDNNYKKMKISVNMTSSTFESENMIADVLQVLKETKIDTSWLVIEITEESGLSDMNNAKILMNAIKKTGIRFALDDFGTGYSSLSYLDELPFDFLKIDKAFIDNIQLDERAYALYNVIVNLAKLFNMEIIAEGVECIEQLDIIKENKNIVIQGYYYSKPLKLEDFEKYLQKSRIDE